jgi:hypothetical protein
MPPTL